MASFTFGTGNARKIAGLPLYLLGGLVSLFIPRSKKLWVYGSGIGLGEGALPLFERARERLPEHRHVWMARTRDEYDEAKERGFDVVRKNGIVGWWTTARAKVVAVTHGFGDVNRYAVRGAFIVQLWHGLPFKHLHLDSPSTYTISGLPDTRFTRWLLGRAYRRAGRAISLFPVASEKVKPSIVSGFGAKPENVVVLGDVRDDVILTPGAGAWAHELMMRLLPHGFERSRVILFAPTWRDGADDPTVPDTGEWYAIGRWLEAHNAVLLVRNHPLGRGDFSDGPEHSRRIILIDSDTVTDLNPLLPAVHAVVTDYSSLVFDYALIGRPVVYFTPDLADYTARRGFYLPVDEFTGGRTHPTWASTLRGLTEALSEGPDGPAHRQASHLRQDYFDVFKPGAADRVLDTVVARITKGASATKQAPVVARPTVTRLAFHEGTATLHVFGLPQASLIGAVARVDGRESVYPLLQSRWGSEPLALPSGTYRLTFPNGSQRVRVDTAPIEIRHSLFHASVRAEAGGLVVETRAPLNDDLERGPQAQKRLEKAYRRGRKHAQDAVFFESFRGKSVACNPRAIDRAIAAQRPKTIRYWSVVDGSVEVPAGAVRVIEGSRAWWRARRAARVLVVNDWLRKRWKRRPYQNVLQTWHGSTLKRLARDRPDVGARSRIAARREGKRWDALLAQNEFSAMNLRSAYAFKGPIWVEGYPRNDSLVQSLAPGQLSYAIYHRLGIDPSLKVMLWAPTWRHDRSTIVEHLDLTRLAARLGPEWIVLVRGHVSTLGTGVDQSGNGILDVTTYPDISDLLQVTDVLVTDYSSVMFDWIVTGRPIVFCVPDLDHYANESRGFYADLLSDPPGPVVYTTDEVALAVSTIGEHTREYARQIHSWRERFVAEDDGHAAERVLERMVESGWLSPTAE